MDSGLRMLVFFWMAVRLFHISNLLVLVTLLVTSRARREAGGKGKYWERWEEGSERGEEDSGRGPGATERVRVVRNLEKGSGARRKEEGGRRMGDLGWRMEDGGRRMEDLGGRMEDVGWRKENGGRRKEDGGWRMMD